jgi:hypothetical protein
MPIPTFNIYDLMSAYSKNKDIISSYFSPQSEHYSYNYTPFQTSTAFSTQLGSAVTQPPILGPDGKPPILGPDGKPPIILGPGGQAPIIGDQPSTNESGKILGMALGLFVVVLIIFLALFMWALVSLIQNWNYLETWVKVISLMLLFIPSLQIPFSPIIVLILVKATSTMSK